MLGIVDIIIYYVYFATKLPIGNNYFITLLYCHEYIYIHNILSTKSIQQ